MTTTSVPEPLPEPGPGAPTPPIALAGDAADARARLAMDRVEVPAEVLGRLTNACATVTDDRATVAEASRDWWPLAMVWATEGAVAGLGSVVCRPSTVEEVPEVLAICNAARIPVTAAAGRSGVCGASVPLYGGVVLDLCDLAGIRDVDDTSMVVDVLAGTFGDHFEHELRNRHNVTVGHWPQSMALSTVGGWLACRGAGQLSNRYGKIEDMVIGLDVVLADGTTLHTGGQARQSVGPDLNQLFVGSEGTLGIITGARLRAHPAPVAELRAAYQARRDFLLEALAATGLTARSPEGAYFILAGIERFPFDHADDFCRYLVTEIGVAAIPPATFYIHQAEGKQLVRFTFCKRWETLEAAAERLVRLRA